MAVTTNGLVAEFFGGLATGSGPGTNSPSVSTWSDIYGSSDASITYCGFTGTNGWVGAGTAGDPYRLRFDGATHETLVQLNTGLGLGGTKNFTYEIWCYVTGTRASVYTNWVTERPSAGSGFSSILVSTTNLLGDWMDSSSGECYPMTSVPDTSLHHICIAGTGSYLRLYVDGSYITQSAFPAGSLTTTTTCLGNWPGRTASVVGDLCTARFYNTAIGDAGVSANYAAGVLAYVGAGDTFTGLTVTRVLNG